MKNIVLSLILLSCVACNKDDDPAPSIKLSYDIPDELLDDPKRNYYGSDFQVYITSETMLVETQKFEHICDQSWDPVNNMVIFKNCRTFYLIHARTYWGPIGNTEYVSWEADAYAVASQSIKDAIDKILLDNQSVVLNFAPTTVVSPLDAMFNNFHFRVVESVQ